MIMTVVWLIAHPYLEVTGQINPYIRVSVSLFLQILMKINVKLQKLNSYMIG